SDDCRRRRAASPRERARVDRPGAEQAHSAGIGIAKWGIEEGGIRNAFLIPTSSFFIPHFPRRLPVRFPPRDRYSLPLAHGGVLDLGVRPLVMGILNVAPDSFAESGARLDLAAAVDAALRMEAEGADIIDIGGESTRPGADPVSVDEERARVLPV